MSTRPPEYTDFSITVAGGIGHYTKYLTGRVTRIRFIPPSAGDFKAHVEDETDGIFSIGNDAVMNGSSTIDIPNGEVFGTTNFYITNTALSGVFTVRVWGYFHANK